MSWTVDRRARTATPPADTLGARVAAARKTRGISQSQLASAIGWRAANLSRLEREQNACDSTTLVALADALGVSADELLGRSARGRVGGRSRRGTGRATAHEEAQA